MLRRVPLACLLLLIAGTLTASARLYTRRVQESTRANVTASSALPAAYGEEAPLPARFSAELTYTSLDAPGSGEASTSVTWDDSWFTGDEHVYNHELARASSVLAALAYSESGYYQSGSNQPRIWKRLWRNSALTRCAPIRIGFAARCWTRSSIW